MEDARRVDADEALAMLDMVDGCVHTFRQMGPGLVGSDWRWGDVYLLVRDQGGADLAGPVAARMGHGLAVDWGGSWLFLATKRAEPEQ